MQPSKMLHQMCHVLLAGTDVKALCQARRFPPEATASRGILEALFLSPQGLSNVFDALDSREVSLLHLLKHTGGSVDLAFFSRIYGENNSYGSTFTQRFKNCFDKVKQRLVRSGVLLMAEAPQSVWEKKSKLARLRFALPAEFYRHLPVLIPSARQFEGDGNWRSDVVRDQLIADLRPRKKEGGDVVFQIEGGDLLINGKPFGAASLAAWQQSAWSQATQGGKKSASHGASNQTHVAGLRILSDLPDGHWANAEQLAEPFRVFCGSKIDAVAVCQAGWEWGVLAKRRADGMQWYRPVPQPPDVAPHRYLTATDEDGFVTVDLTAIAVDGLEQIVAISDVRSNASSNALLLTPNFIKLGRASDQLLASEPVQWLRENTQSFAEAHVTLGERRGKTILHEGVQIARIRDLSLKVTIEKALGDSLVSLQNDFVAFPLGCLDEVRRVVKKSGHVIKEVAAK